MIRSLFLIGRILAALGAVLIVGVLILSVISFANAGDCPDPDCDDVEVNDVTNRSIVLLPIAVFVGAAGVALIHDTYRKL